MFAAQVDFTYAGDLKVFVDEERIQQLEAHMQEQGYLEASRMANTFNMLRSNDLIWPYVVNNYLRGKKPYPFDILYWNADATRMPAANHSFYLRNCYLNNRLTKGEMEIAGVKLDLKKVTVPIYNLATREDHIAPAKSVLHGSQFFGGPVKYVLAGSGHIAGVVNPPSKPKYQYWTGNAPSGSDVDAWMKTATEHPGSWWPDWLEWIKSHGDETVPARAIGGGKLKPTRRTRPARSSRRRIERKKGRIAPAFFYSGRQLDRHFQIMHAVRLGRRKLAGADVDLDRRQQQQRRRQSRISLLAHRDEIILADACMHMHVARPLLADRGLPGIVVAAWRLVVVAHEQPRLRSAATGCAGSTDRAHGHRRRESRRAPCRSPA